MPAPQTPTPPDAPSAQDDLLGEAARNSGRFEPLRDRPQPDRPPAGTDGGRGEARPGRDENQAGFVKDEDKRFAP